MFWFLRRTEAFLNSFNNSSSTSKAILRDSDRNNSWLRFRYGRLSMDSDDQNFNSCNSKSKCDIENNLIDNYKADSEGNNIIDEDQGLDKNGNRLNDKEEIIDCSCTRNSNDNHLDEKIMRKLQTQAMSISDDDYDESLTCNVCDRAFKCHRQLASHQQKKRHFGCSACDTLFPSLMLLEHHKEEYEHWDETEDFHGPCCRHNRRDDFDFSDSETCTSDAESEDLERLL